MRIGQQAIKDFIDGLIERELLLVSPYARADLLMEVKDILEDLQWHYHGRAADFAEEENERSQREAREKYAASSEYEDRVTEMRDRFNG